jgi:hypothetical protein
VWKCIRGVSRGAYKNPQQRINALRGLAGQYYPRRDLPNEGATSLTAQGMQHGPSR